MALAHQAKATTPLQTRTATQTNRETRGNAA